MNLTTKRYVAKDNESYLKVVDFFKYRSYNSTWILTKEVCEIRKKAKF